MLDNSSIGHEHVRVQPVGHGDVEEIVPGGEICNIGISCRLQCQEDIKLVCKPGRLERLNIISN